MPTFGLTVTLVALVGMGMPAAVGAEAESWAVSIGGSQRDWPAAIALDGDGNVLVLGHFQGEMDVDPGEGTALLSSAGGSDVFLIKLNASGGLLWARRFGGRGADEGRDVAVDARGNVYVTGFFSAQASMAPDYPDVELSSAGSADAFVMKVAPDGRSLWAHRCGGKAGDVGYGIATAKNSVYVTGYFQDRATHDAGDSSNQPGALVSSGKADAFALAMDVEGGFRWASALGGPGWDEGRAVAATAGGAALAGHFEGRLDRAEGAVGLIVESPSGAGSRGPDLFVGRLDGQGGSLWLRALGSAGSDLADGLTADASGAVYVTGQFSGPLYADSGGGDPILDTQGGRDAFVLKLTPTGELSWGERFGGPANDFGRAVVTAAGGGVHVTGILQIGEADATAPATTYSFVYTLDASGRAQTERTLGRASRYQVFDLAATGDDTLYVVGAFRGRTSIEPGGVAIELVERGKFDVFVARLGSLLNDPSS